MPRLPRILADAPQTSGGSSYRAPMPSDNGLASAVSRAGASISNALAGFADLEREKKNVASKQETDLLSAELERDVAVQDSNLRTLIRDPDEYTTAYRKMLEDVTTATRKRASSGEVAARFDAKVTPYLGRKVADGVVHSNSLFKERGMAQLDATLEERKMLAGLAMDDVVFDQQMKKGLEAIDNATWMLQGKAGDAKREFKDSILGARAYSEAKNMPERFLETADSRYAELDAKKREELKVGAKAQIETDRKSRNAEWESYFKRMDDEAETERKNLLTTLAAEAEKGLLTVQQIDDARAQRIITTPEEYRTLLKASQTAGEERSDPDTLTSVQLQTRSAVPRITPERLDSLFLAGKLSRKDWTEEKGKLQTRLDFLKSEGRTERNQEGAQAEQVLKAKLGLTAPQDQWDKQDGQLYALALDELTARTFGPDAKEKALDVANEIATRMAPIRQERIKMTVETYKQSLPVVLRSDTSDKALQGVLLLRQSGAISQGTYDAYRRTILDWKRLETYGVPKTESGTTGGSGAKLGRPSGTKAESGTP
jgi:hypothetical protein